MKTILTQLFTMAAIMSLAGCSRDKTIVTAEDMISPPGEPDLVCIASCPGESAHFVAGVLDRESVIFRMSGSVYLGIDVHKDQVRKAVSALKKESKEKGVPIYFEFRVPRHYEKANTEAEK